MLGHQQLLQQQHQYQHQRHTHPHQSQQSLSHQDLTPNSHNKQPHLHHPLSTSSSSSTTAVSAISIKPTPVSASLPPAYPYSSRSSTTASTPSLPSVSSSSTTLASVSGEVSTGANENFVPNIKKAKYSTSLDPRGFIPVYEYELYGHPIMWDQENLYVHFTGIWKALGKTKADIVKIIDANPILETIIRKVRGGFLKIQGTWMPHQEAYDLAKKTCYKLRYELVPVFGPGFVNDCIPPDAPGFGSIHLTVVRRRASECAMGQRQAIMGAQQLRIHQTHIHPSLKRRYSSNDVSRLGRFNQSNGAAGSQLSSSSSSTSFLLNRNKDCQRDGGSADGDHDDDVDLDMDDDDLGSNHSRKKSDQQRQPRFHQSSRFDSTVDHGDDDDDDNDRLIDSSTGDDEDRQSFSGSYDDEDIDIDGESCMSEQEDPMYGLARLDLSRRNSSPMPMSAAYALSGSGNAISKPSARGRRGRPPTRSPMPMASRIAANYVAYNNYVSSNTQAAQGLGRSNGHSTRTQKQQLRQQQKLQNQLLQQQRQQQQQQLQLQLKQQKQHQQQQQHQKQHQYHQQQHIHSLQIRQQPSVSSDQDLSEYQGSSSAPTLSGLTHQELVEFFKAGQALQRMSQDDGVRPWKQDGGRMILPKKIVLGEQVFQCVGGEYRCVAESNSTCSSKSPGEDDVWSS